MNMWIVADIRLPQTLFNSLHVALKKKKKESKTRLLHVWQPDRTELAPAVAPDPFPVSYLIERLHLPAPEEGEDGEPSHLPSIL